MVTFKKITNKRVLDVRDLAELWEFGVRLYPGRVARLCHARGCEIRPTLGRSESDTNRNVY